MKKLLFLLLLPGLLCGQAMTRLGFYGHKSSDWMPALEKTGNLSSLPPGKFIALHILHGPGEVSWSGVNALSARGVKYSNVDDAPATARASTPGSQDTRAYCQGLGLTSASQLTESQAYALGRTYLNRSGIVSEQFAEGYGNEVPFLMSEDGPNAQQYRWTYKGMLDAVKATTPQGILAGGYNGKYLNDFHPGGGAWNPFDGGTEAALSNPVAARSGVPWFSKQVSHWACALVQGYPSTPSREYFYTWSYAVQRLALATSDWAQDGADIGAILYAWPSIEGQVTAGWNLFGNSFGWETRLVGGTLYRKREARQGFNSATSAYFMSLVLGKGLYVWESGERFSVADSLNYTPQSLYHPADRWAPTAGVAQPAPTGVAPRLPDRSYSIHNAPWVAGAWLKAMYAAGGNNWKFHRFQVSGTTREPRTGALLNNATILYSARDKVGVCLVTKTGTNGYGIFYCNPYAPIGGEFVTVPLDNGFSVTFDAYGNEPVGFAGTVSGNLNLLR